MNEKIQFSAEKCLKESKQHRMLAFITWLHHPSLRLIQASFLMLFVELTLIRWAGANIFFLGFFSNFVLLASFLGIGIGFIRAKSGRSLLRLAPIYLALMILFCSYFAYDYPMHLDKNTDDLNYYGAFFRDNLLPIWLSLPIVFLATMIIMMSIADEVARIFQQFKPLAAYRLEIIGSLLGVSIFSLLAFLNISPLGWGIIICLLFFVLLLPAARKHYFLFFLQMLSLFLMLIVFANNTSIWSPYYKIKVAAYSQGRYAVNVNGVPQQFIESVEQRKIYKPFYFFPYQHLNSSQKTLDNVLIVGAGTGGDVAIALAQGAKHVDAVEIDPMLYRLGRLLNPDHPYQDPRVRVFLTDGRAFLQQSTDLYDLILFALPDSLMILSGQSSLRLENYLFTLEAMTVMKQHLKPMGVFSMYNYYRETWIVDRFANTLTTVFSESPCLDTAGSQGQWLSVLTVSATPTALHCAFKWQPLYKTYISPSTDDHPFIYLKDNHLSWMYVLALLFVLTTLYFSLSWTAVSYRAIKTHADLFLMGVAFLLLEAKSVVNFALFFGSTWFVNALVFIGVLLTVYFAVEVTRFTHYLSRRWLYFLLLMSLVVLWIVPNSYLLSLNLVWRFLSITILTFSPIFLANLIFAERFKQTNHSTEALGVNVIGAVIGGLLEYSSTLLGYRHLLILIGMLYLAAILVRFIRQTDQRPLNVYS